ncbi:MAG: HAD hydrolase family protein, partial [Desulfamplus sp.]|nr:HAD hydrolase family protein [Desulfamplus sp.]
MPVSNFNYKALVCDLDGTLLHAEQEAIAVPGRTRASFLSADAALLLAKISRIFPVVIATGRNAMSVHKLVRQLPDVEFSGFVLENGFVVKDGSYANNNNSSPVDINTIDISTIGIGDHGIDDSETGQRETGQRGTAQRGIGQSRIDDSKHSRNRNAFAQWDK